jgi:hypothetical protein
VTWRRSAQSSVRGAAGVAVCKATEGTPLSVFPSQAIARNIFDAVQGNALGILGQAERGEPSCDILHRRPPRKVPRGRIDLLARAHNGHNGLIELSRHMPQRNRAV